jgi:hypothetical protein
MAKILAPTPRYKEIMEKSPEEFKDFAQCLDWYG